VRGVARSSMKQWRILAMAKKQHHNEFAVSDSIAAMNTFSFIANTLRSLTPGRLRVLLAPFRRPQRRGDLALPPRGQGSLYLSCHPWVLLDCLSEFYLMVQLGSSGRLALTLRDTNCSQSAPRKVRGGLLMDPRSDPRSPAWIGTREASAFTRAFRRWSGQTPTTWRDEGPHE
jgi:hypothetical protein